MTASWVGLADALGGVPDLRGAACVGRWSLFDPRDLDAEEHPSEVRLRHEAAKAICRTCPILEGCSAWAASLVPGEVSGVLAGEIYKPPTKAVTVPDRSRRRVS